MARNYQLTQTGQEVQDILNRAIVYGTTSYWESLPDLVPVEGQIVVYSDYSATEPGLKVGDGVTAVGALAFLGAGEAAALMQHIEDTVRHITASERSAWNAKQDAEPGKGLSTEDYTTAEKEKLAGIEAGADRSVNADWDASSGKAEILHKPDLSQFVTKTVNDLVNYYLKSEVYTKEEVAQLLSAITTGFWQPVPYLPEPSADTFGFKIYLVPSQEPQSQNVKDEYITVRSGDPGSYTYSWELIGSTAIDLSDYVTNEALQTALEGYVSTEAFQQAMSEVVLKVKVGNVEYTPSNGTVSLPAYPTTLPASDVYAWAKAQNPPQEIFWAIYGTTTASEIQTAINSGKLVLIKTYDSDDEIGMLSYYDLARYFFIAPYYNGLIRYQLANDVWSRVYIEFQKTSDLVTSWNTTPSDSKYPSEKLVKNSLNEKYVKPTSGIPASDLASGVIPDVSGFYTKPSGGIPASDLASGVIPDVSGFYTKPANGIPASDLASGVIPTVPTISTDIDTDAASDAKTASPKAVKTFVEGKGYGTYSKPSGGIPSTDLASAVQTALGKGVSDVSSQQDGAVVITLSNGDTYTISLTHTHPDKEDVANKVTSLSALSTDTQYPSAKCVYDEVHPAVASSQPQGGFLPNVFYNLGELDGNVNFDLATPTDVTIVNHYYWTFDTPSTAPTITWPAQITSWRGGSAPTIAASKHYEVSVIDGVGTFMEV